MSESQRGLEHSKTPMELQGVASRLDQVGSEGRREERLRVEV